MMRTHARLSDIPRRFLEKLFDLPYVLLPLAPLFWSGNFILARIVRTALPPIGLAFWRWCLSSLIILPLAWPHLKRDLPTVRRHWRIIVGLAALGIAAFNTLVYIGLRSTTALNAVLLQSATPVLIIVMSYLLFHETLTLIQTTGVMLSLLGAFTIVTQGQLTVVTQLSLNGGDLLILIAGLCYAAYSALLRKRPPLHPFSFLAATFLSGTILLFPLYLWEHLFRQVMPFNRVTLLAVGYVAIFPSMCAYLCFNRGVELIGANRAGLCIHLMPVFGSIMAIFFLGEAFRWFHGLGILFILTGIVLTTRTSLLRKIKKSG